MSDLRFYLSWAILLMSLVGIFAWVLWAVRWRRLWYFAVAPLLWLLNVAVFYTVVIVLNMPAGTEFFATWSAVLRLQALITILAGGIIFLDGRRKSG